MKLEDARISILIDREKTRIELHDMSASIMFLEITLTAEQLSSALSRLAYTECEIEINGFDKIGKSMELSTLEFELPESIDRYKKDAADKIKDLAIQNCPVDWKPDLSFNSQNSFFSKDGKQYARTFMRRWINKPKN